MNEKFGQFTWNNYKDVKPAEDKYIYAFFPEEGGEVYVGMEEEFAWEGECYWCYVFIPDAPKIEKMMTIEERMDAMEKMLMNRCSNEYILDLEKRLLKVERLL